MRSPSGDIAGWLDIAAGKNLSAIAPFVTDQRFGDIYPGFEIGFSYHLDFGRKYKSVDRKLYNSDNESGILNSRK